MLNNKNFIGSVFMVSGCAMGAGCLAMPLLTAMPGFILSSIAIILTGIFSYFLASVSLEIFVFYRNDVNVSSVVSKSFGKTGVLLSGIINIALMFSLLSVYMTGGADLLNKTILPILNIHVSSRIALVLFLVIMLPIFFKGALFVVQANKFVFFIKLISFVGVIALGVGFFSPTILPFELSRIHYLPRAIPILLGSLWFHFMIPVIAKINNYERNVCKKVFAVGLAIPVILYLLWLSFMLSAIPLSGEGNTFTALLTSQHDSVGSMVEYVLMKASNATTLKFLLNVFTNIAMLTSFLTVGLSTYDYIRDALKIKQNARGILDNLLLTMLPPIFFAFFLPNGFIFILQQSIILLVLINIFMLLCCLKKYEVLEDKPSKKFILLLIFILLCIIMLQLADDFSFLPQLSNK